MQGTLKHIHVISCLGMYGCVSLCAPHVFRNLWRTEVSNPLELKLQRVASHHVGAGI